MVKLQRRFAYDYNDKKYYKHIITIPEDIIEKLGWEEGTDIQPKIRNNELVFRLSSKKENEVKFE